MTSGFLPAIELRPVWDNFVRVLRSAPGTFDGRPSVHKLHAALLRETVKAAHARAQSVPTEAPNTAPQAQLDAPELSPQPTTVTAGEVSAPSEPASPHAAVGYTMGDIRDLLRYQRELARYEEWRRSTYKSEISVTEFMNRAYSMALNSPQRGRLTPDRAVEIAVYRRLVKACLATFHKELDEQALMYFVGEVADQHGRTVEEMWALSTDEFGPLMGDPSPTSLHDSDDGPKDVGNRETNEVGGKAAGKKVGGRPPIDPVFDNRVWEAWNTGRYPDYAALAQELKSKANEIKKAVDRMRKKKRPA